MAADITKPVVVIVGPTASGKTAVAIELAKEVGGEIICADSRTVYKGLDIGTAKPTTIERKGVAHHLLDIREPNQIYSAAQFKAQARQTIEAIQARGRIPFVVGGSGLYIDGLIFDYQFGKIPDPALRSSLEKLELPELLEYCTKNNISLPDNIHNKRYVIRAIEQNGINHIRKDSPFASYIVVGITTPKDILRQRIEERARRMLSEGIIKEAQKAASHYGWQAPALQMPVYRLAAQLINKEISQQEAIEHLIKSDLHLAKKQLTWFRRNEHITWLPLEQVHSYIARRLSA